jgi:hypothetical protein
MLRGCLDEALDRPGDRALFRLTADASVVKRITDSA